ncbi:cupin domain-containing protein [Bradyrhizobium sp. UFLA05-153]
MDYAILPDPAQPPRSPPLHTHSREDELVYVVQGQLIARVGDARVEVGPGAYAALPGGVPHTIEVVGDQATLLLSFVPGGLERFLVPRDGAGPCRSEFILKRLSRTLPKPPPGDLRHFNPTQRLPDSRLRHTFPPRGHPERLRRNKDRTRG